MEGASAGWPLFLADIELGRGVALDPTIAADMSPALGQDLSDVQVHPASPLAPSIGARAFTLGRHVVFAPGAYDPRSVAGRSLIAHELAHVVQQSAGADGAQANGVGMDASEREADHAASAIRSGGSVGRLTSFNGPGPQRGPDVPGAAEAPLSAVIAQEFTNPDSPSNLDVKVTLQTPGFGVRHTERQTLVLHKPVQGATNITAYQIRLEDLYPSASAAAEARGKKKEDRRALSLAGDPGAALAKVAAKVGGAGPAAAPSAAAADAPGTTSTVGKVPAAGPSPRDTPELAFDLAGAPVALVARSPSFGITTEYTKLAVGAASVNVLKTPTGFTLIDAGVRHDGATKDPAAMEYALKRLKEIVGQNPIEEILISHAHLDHVGLLDAISKEFVIKRISINAIQLVDPRFLEAAEGIGANQRKLIEKQLADKYRAERARWETKPELTRLIPEKGARDAHFAEWVRDQVAAEMAKIKPIEVHVLTPGGSTVDASTVKLGGIEIVPREASAPAEPGEGFSLVDYARATLADPKFKERYEALKKEQETNPDAKMKGIVDEMSSSYLLKLPNGNQLVVVPDIRADDIARIQRTLKTELGRLGADVQFRLWDMTHHMQSGFGGPKDKAPAAGSADAAGAVTVPVEPTGVLRMSQLEQLTEMLTQLTGPSPSGAKTVDAITVSVDPEKVDPALAWLLRSCGLEVFTAQNERDVQFVEGRTAIGRKVAGVTRGRPYPGLRPSDPLLRRTALALERLRDQLKTAEEGLAHERATKHAEADARQAELKSQRDGLVEQRERLRGARARAERAAKDPGPRQRTTPQAERDQAFRDAETRFDDTVRDIEALDEQVKTIRQQGERLAPEVQRLKSQITGIEEARRTYLRKIETISRSPGEASKAAVAPAEGGESPFKAEELALDAKVRPVYSEALETGAIPEVGETTLIILGKGAQTEAGKKLEADRMEIEALEKRIAANEGALGAHARLIGKLQEHVAELKARPDASDAAVVDEVAYYEKQIKLSQDIVEEAAKKGQKLLDRDPTTGARMESSVVTETSTEEAQKASEGEAAKAGAGAPDVGKGALLQKGMHTFGRAMGGVMVYQNVTGAASLVDRYAANKATTGEFAVGIAKSAYAVNIGYRMLKGSEVGMGAFVILSVLDVAQTALADYDSSEQYNTEVTYAIIRNAVNLACAAVGMALIETANPIGVIAGLAIMFLGDTILEALGLHEWLAKKFDPRPDEYIDLEEDLIKLLEEYSVIVGALQLGERTAVSLEDIGARSPGDVRNVAVGIVSTRRADLRLKEAAIMLEFEAAYGRAKQGYAMLPQIDDLRAQFLDFYLRAHKDDPEVLRPSAWPAAPTVHDLFVHPPGPVTIAEIQQRFAGVEQRLTQEDMTLDGVAKMEQWSKMDKGIGELEGYLYRTEPKDIDWMKAWETERNLMMMVSNARYRLDPAAQSANRKTPLFPPTSPLRVVYERLLLERENKLDQLRQRTVEIAIGKVLPTLLSEGGTECEAVDNAPAVACWDVPAVYADPEYGDVSKAHTVDMQLTMTAAAVSAYETQIDRMPKLPSVYTPEGLYSDPDLLDGYHDAAMGDSRYKSALFELKASSIATKALVERLRQVAAGRQLTGTESDRVQAMEERFRLAEQKRRVDKGFLFLEEVPALKEHVQAAHAKRLSTVFGDPVVEQLTREEHAAVAADELKGFQLGTLTDRLVALNVRLPDDPDRAIDGVFTIAGEPGVVIATAHDELTKRGPIAGPGGSTLFPMAPVSAAAIDRHGRFVFWVDGRLFQNVTVRQLLAMHAGAARTTP